MPTLHLQGDHEPFDITLKKFFADNMDSANYLDLDAVILAETESVDADRIGRRGNRTLDNDLRVGMQRSELLLHIRGGDTLRADPQRWSVQQQRMVTTVYLDVYAASVLAGELFCKEANAAVRDHMPNNSVRVPKSSSAGSSAIASFDRQAVEWLRPPVEPGARIHFAGELGCVWQTYS